MSHAQPAILAPVPAAGRFLALGLQPGADPRAAIIRLATVHADASTVVGLGEPLVRALGHKLDHLRAFPSLSGPAVAIPSTQGALWAFLGGDDPGALLHRARDLVDLLGEAFRVDEDVAAFQHAGGRDLSGYEDGTENPKGAEATAAAIVAGAGEHLDGSSFVAAQRWVHDLSRFDRLSQVDRDHVIGRRREDNEELEDAPAYAHVKRSAQESFEPEAFMLRRSMPFGSLSEHGLYFVAYGKTPDAFERVLHRMAGLDDGIPDGLFRFSRAISGGYYWCPPLRAGKLDLRAVGH
jgi:porphyrinogen peroxidase